jgi:hypothetical protein
MGKSVGELFVIIGADAAPLTEAMKQAGVQIRAETKEWNSHFKTVSEQATKVGVAIGALGAGILAFAGKSIQSFMETGDAIQKMALKTGFSTEALSELKYAADLSGTSLEGIQVAVRGMANFLQESEKGTKTYTDSLDQMGLSVKDFQGLSPEQSFWKLADSIAAIDDPLKQAALAQDAFGKSGMDLLPLLKSGADGLSEMRQEAHDLGVVFDQEAADAAANLQDQLTKVKTAMAGVANTVAETLIPIIVPLVEKVKDAISGFNDWAKGHEWLIKTAVGLGIALVGAGGLLIALGQVSKAIVAINSALIIMQSLSGPTGWATLAAGVAIAGATIYGVSKLMGSGGSTTSDTSTYTQSDYEKAKASGATAEQLSILQQDIASYDVGGIVPGPIGAPQLAIVHGGENITPVGGSGSVINNLEVNIETYGGDDASLRNLTRRISQMMSEETRRSTSNYGRAAI